MRALRLASPWFESNINCRSELLIALFVRGLLIDYDYLANNCPIAALEADTKLLFR